MTSQITHSFKTENPKEDADQLVHNDNNSDKKQTKKSDSKLLNFILSKFDRKKILKGEREKKRWQVALDLFFCTLVRLIFIIQAVFLIYYVVALTNNFYYIFSIVLIILIIADGLYVSVFRLGMEHTW
jgi:hypothetical protein